MKKTVAVMQPYWLPYIGYYRLLAAAELFVVLDCVQFPRRGYVHRNKFIDSKGDPEWITLPLKKAPREACISEIEFRPDADDAMRAQLNKFPLIHAKSGAYPLLEDAFTQLSGSLNDKLVEQLVYFRDKLRLQCEIVKATELDEFSGQGQDLILEIVQKVGGERYVNPPGGKQLYDHSQFTAAGVELRFLSDYQGSYLSIGQEILDSSSFEAIREKMLSQMTLD